MLMHFSLHLKLTKTSSFHLWAKLFVGYITLHLLKPGHITWSHLSGGSPMKCPDVRQLIKLLDKTMTTALCIPHTRENPATTLQYPFKSKSWLICSVRQKVEFLLSRVKAHLKGQFSLSGQKGINMIYRNLQAGGLYILPSICQTL